MKRAAMEGRDGVLVRDTRRDHFAPAREAGHEVRLHQAGGDPEVGFDKAAVQFHRVPARRRSEIDMVGVVAGEVVRHIDGIQHPGSPTVLPGSAPSFGRCNP